MTPPVWRRSRSATCTAIITSTSSRCATCSTTATASRVASVLHAPARLRRRYDAFLGEDGFLDILVGPELAEGTRQIGPFELEAHPVTHSLHSYRLSGHAAAAAPDAPGLVYSGDCGRADDLLPLIRPGDTLLCEAFWSTHEPILAPTTSAAPRPPTSPDAEEPSLILTHILDAHDPRAALARGRRHLRWPGAACRARSWSSRSGRRPDEHDTRPPPWPRSVHAIRGSVAEAWAQATESGALPAIDARSFDPTSRSNDRQPRPWRPVDEPGHEAGTTHATCTAPDRRGPGRGDAHPVGRERS